ncbi:hypothetical protein AG1IA_09402 [Rhizoctonia solani AG-1 IA]|uniref:Uncharacterized protein n=1 Tax=Thanatephorus cucumeris (strain AG1-IA) TaxID=983506 RepID=L8WF19_THACA|nr:hypothetical protein AG1IA_09402 [Rhizoctonia solani AG-1 IA]
MNSANVKVGPQANKVAYVRKDEDKVLYCAVNRQNSARSGTEPLSKVKFVPAGYVLNYNSKQAFGELGVMTYVCAMNGRSPGISLGAKSRSAVQFGAVELRLAFMLMRDIEMQ